MKAPTLTLWVALTVLAAASGAAFGYFRFTRTVGALLEGADQRPRMTVDDLVWSFGKAEDARELIRREPDEEPHDRVRLIRKIRLIVLAETAAERERLLEEARAARPPSPKNSDLVGVVAFYARTRLVPPGDDIPCEKCKQKRDPLPPLPR